MGNIGTPELFVVLIVALLVLGPTRLPQAARSMGKAMAEFRRVTGGLQAEMRDAVSHLENELNVLKDSDAPPVVPPPAPYIFDPPAVPPAQPGLPMPNAPAPAPPVAFEPPSSASPASPASPAYEPPSEASAPRDNTDASPQA